MPLRPEHPVLHLGAGIGGAARLIGSAPRCHVVWVERSHDACSQTACPYGAIARGVEGESITDGVALATLEAT